MLNNSGLELKPVYGPSDAPTTIATEQPGTFPFTRGIHPDMYRGRLWTMRQYAGFGSAEEANARYRFLLSQGTTGLSVAFDLPTQMGRDPDHPLAVGEVGRVGVSIATVDDMERLLADIPLDKISLSMTINATAAVLLGMVLVVAKRRGVSWDKLQGTIQNDILKEYIARGTYIYPVKQAMRLVTDIIAFCGKSVPQWNTISISGYHIREAGCTAVQEVAFTLADGLAYVESARNAGLSVDEFGQRLAFFFNCHNDFFEEIAKFRAARRLWARLMKERFGVTNPRAQMVRFHTQTAGSSLTAQQPMNNVVRTTVQALAAICGGTQSLHTNSADEALGLPTEETARVALRTQQILAHESGVPAVADPLGGSYYVEALTAQVEAAATKYLDTIDGLGGMVRAIELRYPQQEIERAAYEYQRQIETKERVIVGVNDFTVDEGIPQATQAIDPAGEKIACDRIAKKRAERDQSALRNVLEQLKVAARDGGSLMPIIVAALEASATLGEISDVFRAEFGEYTGRE